MTTSVSVMAASSQFDGAFALYVLSFRDGPPELGFTRVQQYHCPSRQQPTWMGPDAESRDSGFDAEHRPGMTSSILSEDADPSTASSDDFGSAPSIARRAALCSIARSGARLAGNPGARRIQAGAFMTSPDPSAVTDQLSVSRNRLVLIVYTAAILVSALLLFSVQPLFTKMVLPRLGGSPAVWSVAMVFFQSLLLGGYAYAHYLMQIRSRMIPVAVHLVLLVVALLTLPLSIASGWGEPPTSGYAFWLLGLFAVSIGLPFFALAANNPLLQAWFVRTGHPNGPDPYFLYASSNIGSFLALLSYPVLLGPMFTLRTQNLIWTAGY